jgi:hypothetical protein
MFHVFYYIYAYASVYLMLAKPNLLMYY